MSIEQQFDFTDCYDCVNNEYRASDSKKSKCKVFIKKSYAPKNRNGMPGCIAYNYATKPCGMCGKLFDVNNKKEYVHNDTYNMYLCKACARNIHLDGGCNG